MAGYRDCVEELQKAGAELDVKRYDGDTTLVQAIIYDHTDLAKELIVAGADVNIKDEKQSTALMYIVQKGNLDLLKTIIFAGAEVDSENVDEMTSLMGAAQQGDVECLKELITAGADVTKPDKRGDTALFWAAYNRYTGHVKQQQRVVSEFSESSMADTKGVLDFLKALVEQASKQATLARHADCVKELLLII